MLTEPVIGLARKFLHGMAREKIRGNSFQRGLFRHGLGAVLAELRDGSMIFRIRPCATWAIETIFLIHVAQYFGGARQTHLLNGHGQRNFHSGEAARGFRRRANAKIGVKHFRAEKFWIALLDHCAPALIVVCKIRAAP